MEWGAIWDVVRTAGRMVAQRVVSDVDRVVDIDRGTIQHIVGTSVGVVARRAVGTSRREVVPLGPDEMEVSLENLDIPERPDRLDHMSAGPNITSQADGRETRSFGQP